MALIGVLTFSDGRDFVHRDLEQFERQVEDSLAGRLREAGHQVVRADQPITSSDLASREGRRIQAANPDLVIFSLPVWAFPHFSMLAADAISAPLLLFSSLQPQYPGMVGMLAAAGSLDQIGRRYGRAWGTIEEPEVWRRVEQHVHAGHAVTSLRGSVFGRFGGRPMGMYTAVANPDEWLPRFGVDVEEIDQWEIVRRSDAVPASRARAGREWLERHAGQVRYDGRFLTPEILERQVRSYHALRELIDEWHLDFSGIKGQPELTTHFCTMDVTEAFLN
ncbi:MAG: fucose isomerase, partial [Candidatus Dormiibacterota bacterium]